MMNNAIHGMGHAVVSSGNEMEICKNIWQFSNRNNGSAQV